MSFLPKIISGGYTYTRSKRTRIGSAIRKTKGAGGSKKRKLKRRNKGGSSCKSRGGSSCKSRGGSSCKSRGGKKST